MERELEPDTPPAAKSEGVGIFMGLFLILLATLIGFFAGMALSIAGVGIVAAIRGAHPNFSLTYRYFAPPTALLGFIGSIVYLVKHRG